MRRALTLVALLLCVGCTRSGTGVELTIDAAGLTLNRLSLTATYSGHSLVRTLPVAAGATLDLVAQLPDDATSVTFDVTALLSGQEVGHGASMPIAVSPHHLSSATITLLPGGGGGDLGGGNGDLPDGGVLWSHQQGTLPPGAGAIRALWGSSGGDVYAAGTATAGANLFHSSDHGAHWTPQLTNSLAVDLNGAGGTSSADVYLVGDGATILHGSGTSWSLQTSPAPAATHLLAVWALSAGDVYIAGSGNVILHSVTGGWVTQTATGTTELRSVWGVAGHLWAVGSGGTILSSTGNGTWSPEPSGTSAELRAVFGTSATDVWVVGDASVVLHSDGGGTWSPAADGVPADTSLLALGGRPGGPLWAAGSGWSILRRAASAWVVEPTGLPVDDAAGDRLQALFAPSAAEVFAGGAGQTLLHRP